MIGEELLLKQGRISEIPKGWKLRTVGSSCSIRNDLRKPISVEERTHIKGEFPYYGPTGILDYINECLVEGTFALIGEDGDHFLLPNKKDQTLLVSGKFNVNNHAHLIESTEKCSAEWFSIYFKHRNIVTFLTRQGASRYKLNKATLERIPILLPSLAEQEEIADVLKCWDAGIRSLEKKIEVKQNIKKGLMQKLLSGQSRLTGFSDDWKTVKLKSLGKTYSGLTGKNKDHFGKGMPFITYMNIFSNSSLNCGDFGLVSIEEGERQNKAKYGDLFFSTSSETAHEVGMSSVLLKEVENLYLNSFCFGFRLNDFDQIIPLFSKHYFRGRYFRKQMARIAQGASRYNLSKQYFLSTEITIPSSIEEQRAIAKVLSDADAEIEKMEEKLARWKDQKKYLLNELVTGSIRTGAA